MVVSRLGRFDSFAMSLKLIAQRSRLPVLGRRDELKASSRCDDSRSRRFTLLSFQRPLPVGARGVKKPPTRARGLQRCRVLASYPIASEGAPVPRYKDALTPPRRGDRRMVAPPRGVSSGPKAHKSALSRLYESPVERLQRQVEVADGLAVHLHRALRDQAARLARRADTEMLDEERGQMNLAVTREHRLRHLVRGSAFP